MFNHRTGTAARVALLAAGLAAAAIGTPALSQTPAPTTPPAAMPSTPAAPAPSATPATPVAPPATPVPGTPATPPAPPPSASVPSAPTEDTTVQTMEIKARPALVLAGSADWENGYKQIKTAIAKVREVAAKEGLVATGHAVTAFVDTDDNGFKFEAMLPIEKAPDGKTDMGGGVRVGMTPAGKALKFQHRGAYEDIDTTYEAITAYLDEKGLEAQNVFVEEYLNEPKGADDTSAEVDIYVLIK